MQNITLEKLYIHNFLSFYESDFAFGKLNCLIAPNNSGKSNLIEALMFLDNLLYQNSTIAIARVGLAKIKNYHHDDNTIKLHASFIIQNQVLVGNELIEYDIKLIFFYQADIKNKKFNTDISIGGKLKSIMIDKGDLKQGLSLRVIDDFDAHINNFDNYQISLKKNNYQSFSFKYNDQSLNYAIEARYESTKESIKNLFALHVTSTDDLLSKPLDFKLLFNKTTLFNKHYFHAHDIKRVREVGHDYLLESGTNLTSFLESLDKETFEDISTSLIGEVELINAIKIRDGLAPQLLFTEEVNGEVSELALEDVSDGTIHFIALMTAIMGNKTAIGIMLEEPERHMHMKVLSTILDTMRDDDKQIFFTTHSTEMLNELTLDEILFLYRDYTGDTKGQRANDIPNIKKIMKLFKNDLVSMIQMGVLGEFDA